MDIITAAIAGALGNLGAAAVLHNFNALKEVAQRKFGAASKLYKALMELEEEPDSKGRVIIFEEEVKHAGADKDADLIKAAQVLLDEVKKQTGGVGMDIGTFKSDELELSRVSAEETGTAMKIKDMDIKGKATLSDIGGNDPKR